MTPEQIENIILDACNKATLEGPYWWTVAAQKIHEQHNKEINDAFFKGNRAAKITQCFHEMVIITDEDNYCIVECKLCGTVWPDSEKISQSSPSPRTDENSPSVPRLESDGTTHDKTNLPVRSLKSPNSSGERSMTEPANLAASPNGVCNPSQREEPVTAPSSSQPWILGSGEGLLSSDRIVSSVSSEEVHRVADAGELKTERDISLPKDAPFGADIFCSHCGHFYQAHAYSSREYVCMANNCYCQRTSFDAKDSVTPEKAFCHECYCECSLGCPTNDRWIMDCGCSCHRQKHIQATYGCDECGCIDKTSKNCICDCHKKGEEK